MQSLIPVKQKMVLYTIPPLDKPEVNIAPGETNQPAHVQLVIPNNTPENLPIEPVTQQHPRRQQINTFDTRYKDFTIQTVHFAR